MQFHSLIHTLAGLNEIQHLSVQFWHLFHPSWLLHPFQSPNKVGKSKEAPRKKPLIGTQTAEAVHQSIVLGDRKEISKVVMCPVPASFPSSTILTSRTASERNSVLNFLDGCRWFETAVHPSSITQPRRCSKVASKRPFEPSIVVHRPYSRRRRYFSAQL